MIKEYAIDYKITTFDADRSRRLRVSSALKLQQELGELHLEACDMPYTWLYEQRMVFIIARTRMLFQKAPELLQKVRLATWSQGTKGMLFQRCYTFADLNGNALVDSKTSFVLLDPVSKKMRRPAAFNAYYDAHCPERHNQCPDPEKLRLPEGMHNCGVRKVTFSDTDYNGHMNNAVYADIACDFVPDSMIKRPIREVQINFLQEALQNDELHIFRSVQEQVVTVCGSRGEQTIFLAQIQFY